MFNIQKIENYINTFLNPLFLSANYQKINNIPLIFDSGNFGEGLVCVMFDKKGSGTSGGCSFDTTDGDEVKTLCFFQSKQCKDCEYKNGFFVEKCFKCGSFNFKYANDTRASISCKAHYDYYNDINQYYFLDIKPSVNNFDCDGAIIKMYVVNKDNKFFNELLEVQRANGSDIKNILSSSIEFWLCCPSLVLEAQAIFLQEEQKVTTTIKFTNYKYDTKFVNTKLTKDCFKGNKNYKKYVDQIDENGYDPITNPLDIKPEKGTHGKSRGITKRQNYQKEHNA
jgi:hypothetical protein